MSRLDQFTPDFQAPVDHFKQDLLSVRTGRATPTLIENILVPAYGTPTPLNQLGTTTVSDPRSMVFDPWDKSLLEAAAKALQAAN
ncbi:MAG: ribosome recycling factor, partial [Patescibacteria group bacterium]